MFMTYDDGDGHPIRWRLFDTGGTRSMAADSNGEPSLSGGGFDEVQGALARWNAVSSTSLSVSYGGASASPPSSCTDETDITANAVVFSDPWVSWFVVVNNGAGDCLSSANYELMLTHEMGHGLGFGHVSDPNALMHANCCHPHNSLDISCTQYLYPAAASTPSPTPRTRRPLARFSRRPRRPAGGRATPRE